MIKNRKRGYSREIKENVFRLLQDGRTATQLAFMYGMDDSTIHFWVAKEGLIMVKKIPYEDIEGEIWYPLIGYEGFYLFSNYARVKSAPYKENNYTERVLTHKKGSKGYLYVRLSNERGKKIHSIHVLMAKMFIPNPLNLPEVNHKNGIKSDFRLDNLEWCTKQQNIQHALKTGLIKRKKLGENPKARKVGSFKDDILIKEYSCPKEAAIDGFHPSNIYLRLKTGKPHKGFIWKYI